MNSRFQCRHGHAHVGWIGSDAVITCAQDRKRAIAAGNCWTSATRFAFVAWHGGIAEVHATCTLQQVPGDSRSEEHTSELQSQSNLVCRLLLEKKKKQLPDTFGPWPCHGPQPLFGLSVGFAHPSAHARRQPCVS